MHIVDKATASEALAMVASAPKCYVGVAANAGDVIWVETIRQMLSDAIALEAARRNPMLLSAYPGRVCLGYTDRAWGEVGDD